MIYNLYNVKVGIKLCEGAQSLRALAAITEDVGTLPCTHRQHTTICSSSCTGFFVELQNPMNP